MGATSGDGIPLFPPVKYTILSVSSKIWRKPSAYHYSRAMQELGKEDNARLE